MLVQLAMGCPAEEFPPRPRYPLAFALFEDEYPALEAAAVQEAMRVMDEGYLAQDYYRRQRAKIPLEGERRETFNYSTYSWTEHISRKAGQWDAAPQEILAQFAQRGFHIPGHSSAVETA